MNKEQKADQVKEIAAALSESTAIFAVDYRGISVPQAADLRTKLADADASFKVVKNRLAKRAIEETKVENLAELLDGPTALTLIKGDPVVAAKAINTFSRDHQVLVFKGGIMDGKALAPDEFIAIARLPAVEVLHGQLVGLIASPLTGLAAGMNNLISGLGRQLAQIAEQGLVTGSGTQAEEGLVTGSGTQAEEGADVEADQVPGPEQEAEASAESPEATEARTEEEPAEDAPVEGAGEDVEEPPAEEETSQTENESSDDGEEEAPSEEADSKEED